MGNRINKPIFLIGCPRSGTTVIFESLYVHPEVGWISQYFDKLSEHPWVSILNPVIGLPFALSEVKSGRRLFPFIPEPSEGWCLWEKCFGKKFLYSSLTEVNPTPDEKKEAEKLLGRSLYFQRKDRLMIKLTGPPRIRYLRKIFPDAVFVNIVRDVRGVVNSLLKVKFWKEGGGLDKPWWSDFPDKYLQKWKEANKAPIALAALQWNYILELIELESRDMNSSVLLTVRYEDFTENPEQVIKSILDFCNLDYSMHIARQLKRLNIRSMNYKWKERFSNDDLILVEDMACEMLKKYNYLY